MTPMVFAFCYHALLESSSTLVGLILYYQYDSVKTMVCGFSGYVIKFTGLPPSSFASLSWGELAPCSTVSGKPHIEGNWDFLSTVAPSCQLCEWPTLEVDHLTAVKSSDDYDSSYDSSPCFDCNLMKVLELESPIQVAPISAPQNLCDTINIYYCLKL